MALFNVRELISMAVKDEETGIAFYQALAEVAGNSAVKEKALEISKQEAVHARRFQQMIDEIGEYKPREQYSGQYDAYVQALLDGRAFPEPEKAADKARAAASDGEAIRIAMGLEKDTLLFLQEMKGLIKPEYTNYVQEIIEEERAHLAELTALKGKL